MKGFPGHRWFGMVAYPERSTAAVTHNRSRTQIPTDIRTAARAASIGIALVTALGAPSTRAEPVYRCRDNQGHAEFSAQPCTTGAETIEVENAPTAGVDMGVGGDFSATVAANRARERERGIARQEQRIRALLRDRDDRLAALRARQAEVGNTRASAAKRRLLAAEIRAATNDYNARLRIERDRLAHFKRR